MKHNKLKLNAAAALIALGLSATTQAADVQLPQAQYQPAMSYSFALAQGSQLNIDTAKVTTESDEYWMTVDAEQLRKGVTVNTSVSGALIKISRSGAQARPLDADNLKLFTTAAPTKNIAGNIIREEDLKATGVFANATAIKMDKAINPGKFQLRYDGPLAKDGQFVIHVKEKYSPHKLQLSTDKQHVVKGEALQFGALMTKQDKAISMNKIDAYVMSPSGKKVKVPTHRMANGQASILASDFSENLQQIEAPVNGLYELHINTVAMDKGLQVLRTGKIAFALAEQTATIERRVKMPINPMQPQANFELSITEPGRYEVRGILYGHDSEGNLQPIMETHSAKNFEAGKGILNMAFDRKILIKSDLGAPYVLKHVRLYDQTRMSRL